MNGNEEDGLSVDVLEALPVMCVVTRATDDGPLIEACNRLFADRLGYDVDRLTGTPLSAVYESESPRLSPSDSANREPDGGALSTDGTLLTRAGDPVDIVVRALPRTDATDTTVGTWALFVDVTERAARERAVRTLYDLTWEFFEADDPAAVVEALGWTSREVLGYPSVRIDVVEHDELVAVVATGAFADGDDSLALDGDDPLARAFRRDEIDIRRTGDGSDGTVAVDEFGELLCLPLGEHGLLSVGTELGETFSSDDVDLGILLARNARLTLDHLEDERALREHERRLRSFIETLTCLLDADVAADALEAAITSLGELFDGQIASLWEHDVEAGLLRPVASTPTARELFDGIPTFDEGSPSWEVFHAGEPRAFSDLGAEPGVHNAETPIRSELIIPIGDYGVLNVGSLVAGAFDELDRSLAELVAATTGVVLSRTETNRRLAAAHERLAFALEGTDTGMFEWDPDTDTVAWDEPLARLFDLQAPEEPARVVDRLRLREREDPEAFLSHVLPPDRNEVAETLVSAVAGTEGPSVAQFRVRRGDGSVRWLSLRVNVVPDGDGAESVVGFCTDITDQIHEEQRFEALIAHSTDIVLVVDTDRRIRYASPGVSAVLGYDAASLLDTDPLSVVHAADASRVRDVLDRLVGDRARTAERVECRVRAADGSWLWFELATSTHRHDAVDGYIVDAREVTRRKRQEKQLDMLNRVIRHNVRNDLNIIDGFAGELLDHDDPAVRRDAARIRRTTTKWMRLSEKVRTIERQVDAADRSETLPAPEACERVLSRLGSDRGERVVIDDVDDVAAPVGIVAAVAELCENGFKHADRYDVTVRLSVVAEADQLLVRVTDDGPGIPDPERQVLEQGRETPLVHGSGLGSWLVHMTTTALGGEVEVDTGAAGSVVTLRLPRVSD